jgi:sensor histidine kinase regulating citrate/malate metabolism
MIRTFYGKLAVSITIMIVISLLIVMNITYSNTEEINKERIYALLSTLVYSGGKMVDTGAMLRIKKPSDYLKTDYNLLNDSVHRLIDNRSDWAQGLYCILYRYEAGILYAVFFFDGTIGVYYPFDNPDTFSLDAILNQGELVRALEKDRIGSWINVRGPIYEDNGNIAGIIEVGLETHASMKFYNGIDAFIIMMVVGSGIIIQICVMVIVRFISYRKSHG